VVNVYLRWGGLRTRIFITSGDKVLLTKGWLNPAEWSLPGGGLHRGETPEVGICREVREETGLVIEPNQLQPFFKGDYREFGFRFPYICFRIELTEASVLTRQKWELADAQWLPLSSLSQLRLNQDVHDALAAYPSSQTLVE
jgi:ADP-ribose pyrophosphatase YjhB (NUDIX family)